MKINESVKKDMTNDYVILRNSVKGIESYQERCKKILDKVRAETKRWE